MGLLMQWALLVLLSWAQLLVGEFKGLHQCPGSDICPGQGTSILRYGSRCLFMPQTLAGFELQPCDAKISLCKDMNLRSSGGTAEPLLGEVPLAGWQPL